MSSFAQAAPAYASQRARDYAAMETLAALEDLKRMRGIGMDFIERLQRRASGLLLQREEQAFEDRGDTCLAFARVSRAVRQIIVLEREVMGLREPVGMRAPANADAAPAATGVRSGSGSGSGSGSDRSETESDRGDLNDLDDYDRRPIEQMVAGIKKTLCIPDGPFPASSFSDSRLADTVLPSHADYAPLAAFAGLIAPNGHSPHNGHDPPR